MLAAMTLVPILMEEGFGLSPIFVTFVLIPNQSVGLVMPMIAGWLYDKHGSRLFRPIAMVTIASGFLALGLLAPNISWWIVPFLNATDHDGDSDIQPNKQRDGNECAATGA